MKHGDMTGCSRRLKEAGYPSANVPCPSGCANAGCKGDPCQGVTCDRPPNKQCYIVPGICSSGTCTYLVKAAQSCDDGDPCTKTDKCDDKGTCAGTAYTCDDSRTCTVDTCDGKGGCAFTLDGVSCLITINNAPTCYAKGAAQTGNACETCNPKTSAAWTVSTGTAIQTWNFDDGTLQGFTVLPNPATSVVKWQVDKQRADSPAYSLYFGNVATHTYDDPGKPVSGQATSPAFTLPTGAGKLCLGFRLYKNTETFGNFDYVKVTLLPLNKDIFNTSTEPLNGCTHDPITPQNFIFQSFAAEIPAAAAGTAVQFRFDFESVDSVANTSEGAYVDNIQVLKGCTP